MAISNKPEEWCKARGVFETVKISKMTLYKLEQLFNIDLNSKILRHNQLVVLSDSYELKIVEALAGIDPRELLKVKGFGRRTIGQIEDLLWHYYIYTLDSYKHGEAQQAALNNHWHFKTSD